MLDYSEAKLSHNLEAIWRSGITGKGVLIAIVEYGVDVYHVDLRENFDASASFNFLTNDANVTTHQRGHGTHMAGIACAVSNNSICGVGAAPSAKFASLIIYDNVCRKIDHETLAKAFLFKNNEIDIYSNSWGSCSRSDYMDGPGESDRLAIISATKFGRRGLGNIILFSASNTLDHQNNCAFNGYPQVRGVFTISSLTEDGEIPFYVQSCTAIVAVTLGNKLNTENKMLFTTSSDHSCSKKTGHTSASTALAAGIFALLLQANKNLSLRQILHLIVTTSGQYDPNHIVNAVGNRHSKYMGFGLLNATLLIQESKSDAIKMFPRQHKCITAKSEEFYLKKRGKTYESWIYTSGCYNFYSCVTEIEEVLLNFTIITLYRNHINIFLTSPSGTIVHAVESRPQDTSPDGFEHWVIKILTFYGETAAGLWKIDIKSNKYSLLKSWQLYIYGSCGNSENNIRVHKKVVKFLCNQKLKIGAFMVFKLCLPQLTYGYSVSEDMYSFSKTSYAKIRSLSKVIKND